MSGPPIPGQSQSRLLRVIFGALALVSVVAGLLLYLFADRLGLNQDTAEIIAIAFLIAGVGDAVVLHYWERIFPGRRR